MKALCRQEQLDVSFRERERKIHRDSKLGSVSNGERERQLESAKALSLAVICRLASASQCGFFFLSL